ncbi:MAG: oxidoreductase [Sphingobacteriales bacterium]|nr:MAG: oxidoreductase [Sphingobacteriales bacterium]
MKQVILITGASSGIGLSTAKLLRGQGHTIYAAARRTERMKELEALGVKLLAMDVTDDASMMAGVQKIADAEGRIDVLVNNAGYGSYGALEDVPLSEARYQFEVNIFGLARLTQLVLPYMRAQRSGKIINISSIGGEMSEPHGAWYHATKFAVEGLSDCLRLELKQFGIDVVVIQPGAIKTEWAGIARENLLKTSGNGPYKDLVQVHANMLSKADGNGMGSDPIVIAKVISKAIASRRPKTRYSAGDGAKPILFVRRMLSDRLYDRLFMKMLNVMGKEKVK